MLPVGHLLLPHPLHQHKGSTVNQVLLASKQDATWTQMCTCCCGCCCCIKPVMLTHLSHQALQHEELGGDQHQDQRLPGLVVVVVPAGLVLVMCHYCQEHPHPAGCCCSGPLDPLLLSGTLRSGDNAPSSWPASLGGCLLQSSHLQ